MPVTYPLPLLDTAAQRDHESQLAASGTTLLVGSVVDMGGVARAKAIPVARALSFHRTGIGASPSWNAFCVDNAIALTDKIGVVGDMRLRADLTAAKRVDESITWAPCEMFDQHGNPLEGCSRGRLRELQASAEAHDIDVLVGIELEFVLTPESGEMDPAAWQGYGLRALLDNEDFVIDLERSLRAAGLDAEQIHAEYGVGQFEISFPPADPLTAADNGVLARLVLGRVARRHGLRVSFSPLPAPAGAGNGAHLHMSFTRKGQPLLSGGPQVHGLRPDGAAALGGIVRGLPDLMAIFAGSVLSSYRLQPGLWSGAHACWGLENREAAVRLCAATPANPHGANIELKCVDTSANPYLAVAGMLGLALEGIQTTAELPVEVPDDPALLPAGTVATLSDSQPEKLDRFEHSKLARAILGDSIVEATVAVRRHETDALGDLDLHELTDRLRFSWSF
ncbi:glutamine synthetase family protein [Nocardia sp. NBC_00508]|uniref:glutamine synthetase family protein n=1 Tax=Nocardia sp. NBC_00508 TaxID=2975992 RepID=UPI002E80FDD2|nr:glutamine synthetase family protein [Nocardia sp. NBC_00508]WUD65300.1 glutamine synthetase family protein [Nocardia sp. NBC_00508]